MIPRIKTFFGRRILAPLLIFLFASAVYLYAVPQPNVFYAIVVLLHALAGVIAAVYLIIFLFQRGRGGSLFARLGWILLIAAGILGILLIKLGTLRAEWNCLYLHILLAVAGSGILFADWAGRRGWLSSGFARVASRYALCCLALAGLSVGAWYTRTARWQTRARIQNPADSPETMEQEGDGPQGDFFPSSAQ